MQNIASLIDYGIIIIMMISILMGLIRGLMREIMSLIIWSAAIITAIKYCKQGSGLFKTIIPESGLALLISFILITFIVLLIGGLINRLLETGIKHSNFTITDRFAGCIFGCTRGTVIIALIMVLLKASHVIKDYNIKGSLMLAYFTPAAIWLDKQLPESLKNIHVPTPPTDITTQPYTDPEQKKNENINQLLNPNNQILPPDVENKVKELLQHENKTTPENHQK